MKVSSCSMVGVRNTGAVSRMKSFQNWPGTSSTSGGGPSRISASSKPRAASVPANDSSMMNTTRWPRASSCSPMPTQLLVGPKAPSGKKTTVFPLTEPSSFGSGNGITAASSLREPFAFCFRLRRFYAKSPDPRVRSGHRSRAAGRRLVADGNHVEGRDGSPETLQCELAGRLGLDLVLDLRVEALRDQDLTGGRLIGKPGREIRDGADRGVVGTALETDLPARRVAECDAGAEVEVVPALVPERRQPGHLLPQRAPQANRLQRVIGHLDRIVEEEVDAVALETADRRVEPPDETADRAVELAQRAHQLLGLDGIGEVRPAAQVGEEDRDLPAVAAQNRFVARGHDRIRELGREEPLEPLQPFELAELRLHALLQRSVQIQQLRSLGLDGVVVALDPQ